MSRARKHIGAAVLLTFLLASCGGGDSSSGRVRNSAIECFNTQEEKDAAVLAAQAEVDAEVVDAQVALDAATIQPLCSEVETSKLRAAAHSFLGNVVSTPNEFRLVISGGSSVASA